MGLDINPFNALGNFVLGWIKNGEMQDWIRLGISFFAAAFISFVGAFGFAIITYHSQGLGTGTVFLLSLATACITMVAVLTLQWQRNPLCKKIPLIVPGRVMAEANKILETEGTVEINIQQQKK